MKDYRIEYQDKDQNELFISIVNAERDGYEEYDNDSLLQALKDRFPCDHVDMYTEFDKLTF